MAVSVGPVLEERVYKAGLVALQRAIGDADLLNFPKRPNGTTVLLRQSFFERLLTGNMDLVSFPSADIIAAQADVRNLSLSQLLFIKCSNLDFNATVPSMRSQSEFLTTVDQILEKRIAASLAARGVNLSLAQVADVVRQVVLVYGVHEDLDKEAIGASDYWFVRIGDLRANLLLSACELLDVESLTGTPVYCHRNLSRASVAVGRAKKQLHWEVELADPSAFESASPARPARRSRLSTGRPSLCRSPLQESSTEECNPSSAEVADVVRRPVAETDASMEALRRELAAAKAGADEAGALRRELAAAKASADEADALRRDLAAAKAGADEADALRRELAAAKANADEASARCKEADERCEELLAEKEEAERARNAAIKQLTLLRAELESLREAAAGAARDAATRTVKEVVQSPIQEPTVEAEKVVAEAGSKDLSVEDAAAGAVQEAAAKTGKEVVEEPVEEALTEAKVASGEVDAEDPKMEDAAAGAVQEAVAKAEKEVVKEPVGEALTEAKVVGGEVDAEVPKMEDAVADAAPEAAAEVAREARFEEPRAEAEATGGDPQVDSPAAQDSAAGAVKEASAEATEEATPASVEEAPEEVEEEAASGAPEAESSTVEDVVAEVPEDPVAVAEDVVQEAPAVEASVEAEASSNEPEADSQEVEERAEEDPEEARAQAGAQGAGKEDDRASFASAESSEEDAEEAASKPEAEAETTSAGTPPAPSDEEDEAHFGTQVEAPTPDAEPIDAKKDAALKEKLISKMEVSAAFDEEVDVKVQM